MPTAKSGRNRQDFRRLVSLLGEGLRGDAQATSSFFPPPLAPQPLLKQTVPLTEKPGGVPARNALSFRVCRSRRGLGCRTPSPAGGQQPLPPSVTGASDNVVKLTLRDKETAQEAVRRFRKLVERSGIKKEMRIREFYEKPSATKRRAKIRAQRRNKR